MSIRKSLVVLCALPSFIAAMNIDESGCVVKSISNDKKQLSMCSQPPLVFRSSQPPLVFRSNPPMTALVYASRNK